MQINDRTSVVDGAQIQDPSDHFKPLGKSMCVCCGDRRAEIFEPESEGYCPLCYRPDDRDQT